MPMMAPWPADTHTLLVLSSGRGSPMTRAWRTSRSVRISSTNRFLFRPGLPPYLADLTPRRTARFLALRIAFIEARRIPFPPLYNKLATTIQYTANLLDLLTEKCTTKRTTIRITHHG